MTTLTEEKIIILIDERVDKKFKECERIDIANEKRATDKAERQSEQSKVLNAISELKKDMQLWTLKVMGTLIVGTGGLVVTILKLYPNVVHVAG